MPLTAPALPGKEMPSAGWRKDEAFGVTASGAHPWASTPRGVCRTICPSAWALASTHFPTGRAPSQPCLDRLLPRPPLTTAGGLFHSNSHRCLPRAGYFYPGTGLRQNIPPRQPRTSLAFSAGCFCRLPNSSGGAQTHKNPAGGSGLLVAAGGRGRCLRLPSPVPFSPGNYLSTAARPASSTRWHSPGPARPASRCRSSRV